MTDVDGSGIRSHMTGTIGGRGTTILSQNLINPPYLRIIKTQQHKSIGKFFEKAKMGNDVRTTSQERRLPRIETTNTIKENIAVQEE